MRDVLRWLNNKATEWLTREGPPSPTPLCDFNRLGFELRTGDIVLVEGRSRVSEVITQSPWSHSALYIGRLYDIRDPDLRAVIEYHYDGDPEEQLLIEAVMGRGTIVSPLACYKNDHITSRSSNMRSWVSTMWAFITGCRGPTRTSTTMSVTPSIQWPKCHCSRSCTQKGRRIRPTYRKAISDASRARASMLGVRGRR